MPSLLRGIPLVNTKKNEKKARPIQTDITYDDIAKIVEYLVKTKARNYTFDCWTEDDIAQEIRIICFKALAHFDVGRVKPDKWQNFFGRCVDNGLKNLKRDNYLRPSSPCKGDCELFHGDSEDDNIPLGMVCKRWLRFKSNRDRKIKVLHPVPIEVIGDSVPDSNIEKDVEMRDLQDHIVSLMPQKLKGPLIKMLNGKDKEVSRKDKQKVREHVNRILE